MTRQARPVVARLMESVRHSPDGCWLWTKSTHHGYGSFALASGLHRAAHRVAYEQFVGPIPDGLVLDHLCGQRACVNPEHLKAVTRAENAGRRLLGRCSRGHERSEQNTMTGPGGRRRCRLCVREGYGKQRKPQDPLGGIPYQERWDTPTTVDSRCDGEALPPCPSCSGLLKRQGVLTSSSYCPERGPASNRLALCLHCGDRFRSDRRSGAPWEPWVWPWLWDARPGNASAVLPCDPVRPVSPGPPLSPVPPVRGDRPPARRTR